MKRIALLATCLVGLVSPAAAHEAPAGELSPLTGEFTIECELNYAIWPSANAQAGCIGDAYGSGSHGAIPFIAAGGRNMELTFFHAEACVLNEPPLVHNAFGRIEILTSAGMLEFDFNWTGFTPMAVVQTFDPWMGSHSHSGRAGGWASFLPTSAPIPTCAAPGALRGNLVMDVEVQGS